MPPSLSELTPTEFNTGLAHLGSEASIFDLEYKVKTGSFGVNSRLPLIMVGRFHQNFNLN